MARHRPSPNRNLSHNEFVLTDQSFQRRVFWRVVSIMVIAGGIAAALIHFESLRSQSASLQTMQRENQQLQDEVVRLAERAERAELDLSISEVTQQELERQISVLKEQLDLTREELAYIKESRR